MPLVGMGQFDIMLKNMSLENSFSFILRDQRVLMDIMVMKSLKKGMEKQSCEKRLK